MKPLCLIRGIRRHSIGIPTATTVRLCSLIHLVITVRKLLNNMYQIHVEDGETV
jgi:hypothetical protein